MSNIVSVFQNIFAAPLSGRTSSTSLAAGTCSFRPTQASKATASRQRMRQELESVFSCSMLPVEYYMEMVHSLSCIGIVDASPAQGPQTVLLKSLVFLTSSENLAGELLKAAMSSRTPCLAICGTDGHCKKLEIMLTEYIYEEQQRDGSTYYIPEMTVKSQNDEPKPKSKAKAKPVTKTRRRRRA